MERVEKEIRDVVGTYLIGGFRGALPGLVTLTRVRCSADLKIANLNFTLLLPEPEGEAPEMRERRLRVARQQAEEALNDEASEIQRQLALKLKMRFTPRVHFHYDEGYESAMKVEKILRDMSTTAGRGDDLPSTEFSDRPEGDDE